MKRGMLWPIAITGILTATVAANIAVAVLANDDPSFAIEPDYYQKAVHWDHHVAQEQKNATLRWHLEPTLGPASPNGSALTVRLMDSTGTRLQGASVQVAALNVGRASEVVTATLPARGAEYAVRLPVKRRGQWELRFTATRGGDRFTSVQRIDVQ
jgi:nitrogen fixation protein FixH